MGEKSTHNHPKRLLCSAMIFKVTKNEEQIRETRSSSGGNTEGRVEEMKTYFENKCETDLSKNSEIFSQEEKLRVGTIEEKIREEKNSENICFEKNSEKNQNTLKKFKDFKFTSGKKSVKEKVKSLEATPTKMSPKIKSQKTSSNITPSRLKGGGVNKKETSKVKDMLKIKRNSKNEFEGRKYFFEQQLSGGNLSRGDKVKTSEHLNSVNLKT